MGNLILMVSICMGKSIRIQRVNQLIFLQFQNLLGDKGQLGMVPIDMCQQEYCEGGCYNKLVVSDKPKLVNSHGASFVGVNTDVQRDCGCRATDHTVPIECRPGYCYHGGSCVKDAWDVVR